ncbi:T9SS type A sorting domain-containing protein [Chryseobacterium sp. R2A-55]|uniref:T9SS type A sorting domain-containing protein n=1 Tax=Chryseobacterium sp. R2A-55 TaxID=2744445 RepID=UPI001F422932|nr:T9SS type A sorting domain-containing protein [Chryseobacterium sp. R2A-55]
MKKTFICFLFMIGMNLFGEIPGIWAIQKIKYQGNFYHYFTPTIPDPSAYANETTFVYSKMHAHLFNTFQGTISSLTDDQITISNFAGTLMQSPDTNFDLFESNFANIFLLPEVPRTFYYEITLSPPYDVHLVLTDVENGNQIYFLTHILASSDSVKNKAFVYPNPVSDLLRIENLEKNSSISMMDSTGKSIYRSFVKDKNAIQISLEYFPAGVYFIRVNNENPIKILKK